MLTQLVSEWAIAILDRTHYFGAAALMAAPAAEFVDAVYYRAFDRTPSADESAAAVAAARPEIPAPMMTRRFMN